MNDIMDNRLESNNKEEEVKRLQELVKKLELQNHELRSERQAILSHAKSTNSLNIKDVNNLSNYNNRLSIRENITMQFTHTSESTDNILDNLDQNLSDEETWLLESPKTKPHSTEWLRKDVDDPSLRIVRKSLANKLEEISGSQQSSPRHSIYSPGSSSGILSPESPPSSRGEIDTRTFIRPKKRPSLLMSNQSVNENGLINRRNDSKSLASLGIMRSCEGSHEYLGHSNGSLGSEEEDRLSSASDGSYSSFRLTDIEDVNALARLQEESLKLPEPRPLNRLTGIRSGTGIASPRNLSQQSRPNGCEGSGGSSQEDLISTQQSPRRSIPRSSLPAPKKYYSGVPQSTSRESSDMSTPPDSPYNSHQNLVSCNGRNLGGRLPSLTRRISGEARLLERQSPVTSRGASPLPAERSDTKLPGRVSRLQAPQTRGTSRLSAPSPVRIPFGVPHVTDASRLNSNRAKTSSGLPKSRLQPPRSAQLPADHNDWREGCY